MNLEPVIARLRDRCPEFKLVEGLAEFSALEGKPKATPACYVVPLGDVDAGEDDVDASGQLLAARFGLCIAASNVRTAGGRDALIDLRALRTAARNALLGWLPDGCDLPVLFDRGDLLAVQAGLVWWQDAFRTAYFTETQ